MDRNKGKELVKMYDLEPLGQSFVSDVSQFLGYSEHEFCTIVERFRNMDIWEEKDAGRWYIPGHLED